MKKVFSGLLVMALSLFLGFPSFGQARLHIVQIDSFPQFPGDTAFEGLDYHNIKIKVTNNGTSNFFGEIKTFLYSQSLGISAIDTLRNDPSHQNYFLLPGDTVSLQGNPQYEFRSAHYVAGDNIIVVWPYSGSIDFDTYDSRVYFAALVGVREHDQIGISLYPNPVSQILHLEYVSENTVEQVRIYDLVGREVFNVNRAVKTINLSGKDSGLYFIEVTHKDGSHAVKKILVEGN